MGHLLPHRPLGVDDVVGPDALEDLAVVDAAGLDPDVLDPGLGEGDRRQDAGLDIDRDADDGLVEVADPQLVESLVVGDIGLDHVGQLVGIALDEHRVGVDGEDLLAHGDQRTGDRGPEPPEPHDEDGRPVVVAAERVVSQ